MSAFPPSSPTMLAKILPAYAFQQFADDVDIQAFFASFNGLAQDYLDFLVGLNLPIYTKQSGSVLDWIAQGVYGISRPSLQSGSVTGRGLLNTFTPNTMMLNSFVTSGSIQTFTVNDDIFKRIITWFFFKGDGQQLSIPWLKRRIMRFLIGVNGSAPNIDNTYPVSLARGSGNTVVITITLTSAAGITLAAAQIFQAAVQSAAIALPFQYAFSVVIVNDLEPTNLTNVSGVLNVAGGAGYPTSATGLPAGAVWSNAGVVTVVPGITPDPSASPLFFGVVTAAQLAILGGGNLPLSNPGVGTLQLWNDSNVVMVA